MIAGNPYPFRSPEWVKHNEAEVAARPTGPRNRKPFNFDEHRPVPAVNAETPAAAFPNELELRKLLGQGSGLPFAAAQRLAQYITLLEQRIAALEAR